VITVKTQTQERAQLLFSILGQIKQKESASIEELNRLTEVCHLLKEDVEVGEKTSGVVEDVCSFGMMAMDLPNEQQREDYIKKEERRLEEYYEHFKKLFEN
jgi:hypothetical protein